MKLLRHENLVRKPGILDQNGSIRDLSGHLSDINGETISENSLKKSLLLIYLHYQLFLVILD